MLNKEYEALRYILEILSHLSPFLVYAYICIKCNIYAEYICVYVYIIFFIYFNKHTLLV